jgi:hypothetical protein
VYDIREQMPNIGMVKLMIDAETGEITIVDTSSKTVDSTTRNIITTN